MQSRKVKITERDKYTWVISLPSRQDIYFSTVLLALKVVRNDDKRCGDVVSTVVWKTKTKAGAQVVKSLTEGS